jgi:hypothetical protein
MASRNAGTQHGVVGAELGAPSCRVGSRTERGPLPAPWQKAHLCSCTRQREGPVSHPRALLAADFFASYFLPEFGGKCWNIFSVSLSKFLMLLLEFPDRSSLADPLHKRLFVFPSKRSTISVPTL